MRFEPFHSGTGLRIWQNINWFVRLEVHDHRAIRVTALERKIIYPNQSWFPSGRYWFGTENVQQGGSTCQQFQRRCDSRSGSTTEFNPKAYQCLSLAACPTRMDGWVCEAFAENALPTIV